MGTFTDRLILQIDARFNNAIKGFSIIEGHLNKLKNSFAKIDSIRNFESTLRRINVGMKSNGKYFDLVTNKIISQTAALQRYDHFKRRGVFNDPNLFADLGIGDVSQKINKVGFSEKILAQVTREMNSALKDSSTQFKKVNKVANMGMLSLGFTLLFTGMALKRFAEGAIKSLGNAFMKVTDNTNQGHASVMALSASFEFLKFTIFDALSNSDMFQNMVTWLIDMADRLSQFTQQHPALAQIVGVFLGLSVVLGTIIMVVGQLSLATVGLNIALLPLIGIILVIMIGITLLVVIWSSGFNDVIKVVLSLYIVLGVVLVIMAILGIAITLPFIVAFIAIGIVVGGLILLTKKLGSVGNAFKAVGIFILAILAFVGDAIIELLIAPLRLFISMLNSVIQAYNFVTGKSVSLIEQPEFGYLSKKVFEMRNNLISETQAKPETDTKISLDDFSIEKLSSKIGEQVETALVNNAEIIPSTQR